MNMSRLAFKGHNYAIMQKSKQAGNIASYLFLLFLTHTFPSYIATLVINCNDVNMTKHAHHAKAAIMCLLHNWCKYLNHTLCIMTSSCTCHQLTLPCPLLMVLHISLCLQYLLIHLSLFLSLSLTPLSPTSLSVCPISSMLHICEPNSLLQVIIR